MLSEQSSFFGSASEVTVQGREQHVPRWPDDIPPRLLLVDNKAGDFLRYRTKFVRLLRSSGFDLHVAVPREADLCHRVRRSFVLHTFYLRRQSMQPLDEFRCCLSLLQLYRTVRPTLVHHIGLKPTLYGGIAARIAAVPAVVNTLTGLGHLVRLQKVGASALRRAALAALRIGFSHPNHRVIFQNLEDRNYLVSHGVVRHDRAVLTRAGSGVDLALFRPHRECDGTPVVLMVSRLLWDKGVGEFVGAAQALRAQGIEARFVLAGEPDRDHPSAVPRALLERWHDTGDIEWLGWRNDVPALMARSHVVCLPSRYGEGIPRVLLQAAASGRPVVATDSVGCREVVRDGENGLLVPVGDTGALQRALARLLQNVPLRAEMGARGRRIAMIEYSLTDVINSNLSVYHSLLIAAHGWNGAAARACPSVR